MLGGVGVVNLYSATSATKVALSELYVQQVYWLVLGGVLGAASAIIDYRFFERWAYLFYGVGIVSLMLVFVLGRDVRGSSRWISIGSFNFQPSEFMKIFLVMTIAKVIHDDPKPDGRTLRDLLLPSTLALVPTFLILRQPDLGTALILLLVFASMAALTKVKWQSVARLVVVLATLVPLIWTYGLKDYQKKRVTDFLNPDANILGTGWHAHHARIAVGNGGVFGQGFTRGTQNQFGFLPDQFSDFPFAVFAEDWGFIGVVFLIALYAFLILYAIRISATAKDRFGAVMAIGLGAILFWHAFFNLGMVVGILPVVGVTLPLFSYGGSSVLTVMTCLGLLMNISIRRRELLPSWFGARG